MVSQTTAIFLAAVFVSAYGLPADSTLVSTPASVGGGAYSPAHASPSTAGKYDDKAVDGVDDYDGQVAPQRAAVDDYATPPPVDYGYGSDVDPWDGRRGRSRSRSRRSDDCSDDDVSVRSYSRHSSHGRRSDSCDSYRSKSCDSRCSRSVSRDRRSDSCDSRGSRSTSRGRRSRRGGGGRRHRRSWHGRRWGHGRRHRRGFWMPIPYGPMPWGPRGWLPGPVGIRPFGPRPWLPRPIGGYPHMPVYRPIRRPHGSHGDKDSDCESSGSGSGYLQKRFFNGRSGVDRVTGLPKIYANGFQGPWGSRGLDQYQGGDDDDYYGGWDGFGVDAYGQDGRRGYGSGGDYGYDDVADDRYRGRRDDDDYQGGGYGRGGRGGRPTLDENHKYSQHEYDANVDQHTLDVNDRYRGRLSVDERHADEQSYDRTGHDRVMVDRYGQRATSRQDQIDAARREADSRDVHIAGPRGSLDHSQRSASEDTFNSDRSERTFNGPNRSASERSFSLSTSSRDFNSESTRIVGRPSH